MKNEKSQYGFVKIDLMQQNMIVKLYIITKYRLLWWNIIWW